MLDNGVIICQYVKCYYKSFENLNRTYPGLFPRLEVYQTKTGLPLLLTNTLTNVKAQNINFLESTNETVNLEGSEDGDSCCQTYKSIVPYISLSDFRRRTNMDGQLCYTIQLFTIGTCGDSQSTNQCEACVQDTNLMSLYSYNYATSDVGFNLFHIESYCSCKA
ncbi:hypothetical protein DPMN_130320 [Dreissena polymorpha]|uniref:Uncharacterized protein n=1 Tax=Dreissena polymorpha TaxID=45954 RepID=A0A9D4HAT2_DREPO|nr:hypothetical protein DPMN_130320 [Dreissena polymorpha]